MVGDEIASTMTVYLNDGKGRAHADVFAFEDKKKNPYAGAAGDLNRDGSPDIVFGYTEGPHLVFFNDGTGRAFTKVTFGDPAGVGLWLRDRRRQPRRLPRHRPRSIRRTERPVL